LKSKSACCILHAGFLLGLLLHLEDGSYMFLQNIGLLSTDHTALSQKIELFKFVTHLCGDGCMDQFQYMILSFCNDQVSYLAEKPEKGMGLLWLEKVLQMSWTKKYVVTDTCQYLTYKEMPQNDFCIY
jgi:hypothetical protein